MSLQLCPGLSQATQNTSVTMEGREWGVTEQEGVPSN